MKISRIYDNLLLALDRREASLFLMFMFKGIAPNQTCDPSFNQAGIDFMNDAKGVIEAAKDDLTTYFLRDETPTKPPARKKRTRKQSDI
jgi:hypothetical protein